MVKILLLALLPLFAVILYFEGQVYDSALINFRSSPSRPVGDDFPRSIDGWNRSGSIQRYDRDNLYEYVNGHAEYFISAGFVGLSVGEYIRTGSDPDRPEAVVEIYDMGKGIQAFGVLSDAAGSSPLESDGEIMKFESPQGQSFVLGSYYIKIDSYDKNVPLHRFTEMLREKIGGGSDMPTVFSRFPALGPVTATRYIKEAYRGLAFMQNVMEREFSLGDRKIRVFLVSGTPEEILQLTETFLQYFRDSEIKYIAATENSRTYYNVMDPYEGDWSLVPRGPELFGLFGASDSGLVRRFFEDAGDGLAAGRE